MALSRGLKSHLGGEEYRALSKLATEQRKLEKGMEELAQLEARYGKSAQLQTVRSDQVKRLADVNQRLSALEEELETKYGGRP